MKSYFQRGKLNSPPDILVDRLLVLCQQQGDLFSQPFADRAGLQLPEMSGCHTERYSVCNMKVCQVFTCKVVRLLFA